MFSLTPWQRYGIAILGVAMAAFVRLALDPLLGEELPLFFFIFPIILAGWSGGLWPGLIATFLSLLLGEYLFLTPRGKVFHYESELSITRAVALGFIGIAFSILFDSTRKAIKAHLECLERFRLLVESSRDHAIFTLDTLGRVSCWNAGAERIEGYREREVMGRDFSMFYMPEDVKAGRPRSDLEIAAAEGRYEEEGWQTRKDGSRFWASGVITPLRDERGQLCGFAKITRDMTARRIAEEQAKFIADLSHALQPLGDPEQIMDVVVRMLGEHLGVDRCAYAEIEGDHLVVMGDYTRGVTRSIVGRHPMSEIGERERQILRENQPYVVHDIEAEAPPGTVLSLYRRAGVRSLVGVPLKKEGNFVARLGVHQSTPRRWTAEEIQLITAVANQCWESADRARLLRSLKKSDERYRAFIANSSEGIWRIELEQPVPVALPEDEQIEMLYKFAYLAECSDTMARKYRYDSADQILGARLGRLFAKSDPQNIAFLRSFMRSGYRLANAETHQVDQEGDTRYFLNSLVAVQENGKLLRAWGTQRDITYQKRAEAERQRLLADIEAERERFAKAFRASPDAMVISRVEDGVILEVNDSFVKLSGYDRDELIGKSPLALNLYADPVDRQRAVAILKERSYVRDLEFRMKRRSGEFREILFSAEPLELRGERCWLTLGRDITEHKQVEKERERLLQQEKAARQQAEEANRMKDQFLALLSHELRTPLTAITGWARLLAAGSLTESQAQRAVQVIDQSARSQARLVEDILDTSSIITGRFKLDMQPVEIARVFRAAVDIIRPAAAAKRIALRTAAEDQIGAVLGDAARLQQVIWNLLSNAVKFTNEGGTVEAELTRSGDQIKISVADTGIGIDPEFMPYIFDRFRQADSTTTRRFGGLGLGLAIVRYVVEMHGGSVSALSPGTGGGATFTVRLPAASAEQPERPEIHHALH